AILAALVVGVVSAAQSQAPDHQGMMNPEMTKMMSDMKAADAKLDALVQAMNAAKGTEKTHAIDAVVTTLVNDRRSMHSSMASMMGVMQMMHNMPSHAEQPARP